MAETIVWAGASDQNYTFYIYELPHSFPPDQDGNYIFCKREGNVWKAIYIGEGDLNDRLQNHHQADCIRRKGATHFHCHKNANKNERLTEERDLLAEHTEAYAPTGCNEQIGG